MVGLTVPVGLASMGVTGAPGAAGGGLLTSAGASGSGVAGPASRPWHQAGIARPLIAVMASAMASLGQLIMKGSPQALVAEQSSQFACMVICRLPAPPVRTPEVPVTVWQSCTRRRPICPANAAAAGRAGRSHPLSWAVRDANLGHSEQ